MMRLTVLTVYAKIEFYKDGYEILVVSVHILRGVS